MTTDHRKLRQLRHAVEQVSELLDAVLNPSKSASSRVTVRKAQDVLRLALEATAPEPDPGDALDAAELHPHRSER